MMPLLLVGTVVGAFLALWYALGAWAGVLWTNRALVLAGILALLGALGSWVPWALDGMLVADATLVGLIWLDATLAARLGPAAVSPRREPLPALSVGHTGQVTYRWANPTRRRARLRVREIRPDLLGGSQPPRAVTVAAEAETREDLPVVPARRGRETAGGFVVDSGGPLGLGRRRSRIALPWEVVVYPPLVSMRLRASVAQALRR
ncbi:MAG: hypothetical protein ACREMC_02675, partial [Gemmatimonadales bacterium]